MMQLKDSCIPAPMSVAESRRIDSIAIEEYGMSGLVLMENAGRGAADVLRTMVPSDALVVILCGPGNNGGDGFVIARHLHAAGYRLAVWLLADPKRLSHDASVNHAILAKTQAASRCLFETRSAAALQAATDDASTVWLEHPLFDSLVDDLNQAQVIVDAMLGSGSVGAPRQPMGLAIELANRSIGHRVAIDIPSGFDADTGHCFDRVFRADRTLTFVASKIGFASPNARQAVGDVTVLPIGVPPEVVTLALKHDH